MSQQGDKPTWPVGVAMVALIVSVIFLCSGLFRQPWSDEVDCGGKTMEPGDTCVSSRGGSQSYDERVEVRENGTWMLILGLVGVGGSILFFAAAGRRGDGEDTRSE
ncbi:hypothetical protein GCM10027290_00750 [Micromonospora sonneratiae]|uniref:MYXO-CTERM domain-containing protein n=1 Tax=Micromonospora sonneratiae TaxID=1184706 RepID=A0ABW3Y876_9ACTN